MKSLFIGVCVLCVAYAGYTRFYATKVDAYGERVANVEVPRDAGPSYVAMEPGGPVYRLAPETRQQLDRRFSSEKVVMFGATWCGYCAANCQIFAQRGVQYVEIDIDRDPEALVFMQKVLGAPGVPTTILGTRLIPGFSSQELEAAIKRL